MTLELLLNNLCELAIKNNLVNYAAAGGSIYNLNGETIKDYPFIFISPTDEIEVGENTTTYGLTIFYCDRLLESKDNDTQIYSIATDTISNFLRQVSSLDGVVDIADYSIRVFSETQKMNDSLNGAYARVRINVLNTAACAQWFDETGAPIGTYIPSTIKDVSVLENLASKAWVKQYVASIGAGITEDEAKELIRKALLAYTKTDKFAAINGSGITDNEIYNLLETSEFNEFLSGYTQEILEIRSEISAATPSDYDELKEQVSANTQDIEAIKQSVSALTPIGYEEIKEQVSANTENISTLSAFTENVVSSLTEHTEKIELIETAVSGINETISTQSSAITDINEAVSSLSAQTSANTAQILALSGYTEQAVSSLTQDIVALSGATSDALSGITGDLAELSGVTGDLEAQIAALSTGESAAVFDMRKYGVTTQDEIDIYNDMLSAYTAGKTIFLVTCIAHSNGLKASEFVITPGEILSDNSGNPVFHFVLMSHLSGPQRMVASDAVNFRTNGASGIVVCEEISNPRIRYIAALENWVINRVASAFEPGGVVLGSGMTQNTYGVANVNLGSGLQFDANGAIENPYQGNVSSSSVTNIWSGSLADYQALGTYSNSTLYLII